MEADAPERGGVNGLIADHRPPAMLFGVPIADVTMDDAIDTVGEMIRDGRDRGGRHQIATVNVDFLVRAIEQPDFRRLLQTCGLCLPDGSPIVWTPRWLGQPIRERVAGADLVERMTEAARDRGWKLHFFGSRPEVARCAEQLLRDRFPGVEVSAEPGPIIHDVEAVDDATLERLASVDADIVCVALGNPKQELFIRAHQARLGTPVMIGIGGSLDLLVGERRRAPQIVQRLGLEWTVRALQEPSRLGPRYAHDIRAFGPRLARELVAVRRRRPHAGVALHVDAAAVSMRIGGTDVPSIAAYREAADAVAGGAEVQIDAGRSEHVRDAAVGHLVGLARVARRHGRVPRCSDGTPALRAALEAMSISPDMLGWEP